MGKDINQHKLVGGKRKNGHKFNCTCHICENMKNKAKRGGYEEEVEKEKEKMMGGSKKKNGHRMDCSCPICKNMKNSKRHHTSKSGRKTKKMRGGEGGKGEEEVTEGEEKEVTEGEEKEVTEEGEEKEVTEEGEEKEVTEEGDEKEVTEEGEEKEVTEEGDEMSEEGEMPEEEEMLEEKETEMPPMGGKNKRGNGHKPGCQSPICKNMRKKKGGNGDTNITQEKTNETQALDEEYDALDAAEKGEAGSNVVGGTRKRRMRRKSGGKKWGGKSRKTRKYK